MRVWRSPLFILALVVSLLLHTGVAISDSVMLWWEAYQAGEVQTTATKRKLKSQSVADDSDAKLLPGAQKIDGFVVRLGRDPQPLVQVNVELPPSAVVAVSASNAKPVPASPRPKPPDKEEVPLPAPNPRSIDTAAPPQPLELEPQAIEVSAAAAPPSPPVAEPAPTPPAKAESTPSNRLVLDGPFPRSVKVVYVVKGLVTADHQWIVRGKQYEIQTRGEILGKSRIWKSEGEIDQHGLRPLRFREYHDQIPEPKYMVDFDWATKKVLYGEPNQQKEAELEDGAQDIFSAAYQFALQGDRLPSFTMQVVSGRNSYKLPFELKGEARLFLSGDYVNTLVLKGVNKQRRFSFYLAPDWHNLPVRMTFDDDGKVTDLIAVTMEIDGKTVLRRPAKREK